MLLEHTMIKDAKIYITIYLLYLCFI